MKERIDVRHLREFVKTERATWSTADNNYKALDKVITRCIGNVTIQYNPAREVSTGASVKASDISHRTCFLCKDNRPTEQHALPLTEEYEILLNPFPIFREHFTVSHVKHIAQKSDLSDMQKFCLAYPDYMAFYNGASSGASAPDHRHFQATHRSDLNLISRINTAYSKMISARNPVIFGDYGVGMFVADAETPEELSGLNRLCGLNPSTSQPDSALRNILMWKMNGNAVRVVVIPRRAHRPAFYGTGDSQRLVSPGAIDMAGLIITPRKKDFDELTRQDIDTIYCQTGYSTDELTDIGKYMI